MKPKFRVVVAGGRLFKDKALLKRTLDALLFNVCTTHEIHIVSGCAKGADKLGEEYADLRGFEVDHYEADWKNLDVEPCIIRTNDYGQYNAAAGGIRNALMADNSEATVVFWDGKSTGSKDMIQRTKDAGNKLRVVRYEY